MMADLPLLIHGSSFFFLLARLLPHRAFADGFVFLSPNFHSLSLADFGLLPP